MESGELNERKVISTASAEALKLGMMAQRQAAKTEVMEAEMGTDIAHEVPEVGTPGWEAGEVSEATSRLAGLALEQAVVQSNLDVKEQVARENGYVDNGVEIGQSVIGGESKLQIQERKAEQAEDARIEAGEGLKGLELTQHRLMTANQERLTNETVTELENAIKANETRPAEIEHIRHAGMLKMLEGYGRVFGGHN